MLVNLLLLPSKSRVEVKLRRKEDIDKFNILQQKKQELFEEEREGLGDETRRIWQRCKMAKKCEVDNIVAIKQT